MGKMIKVGMADLNVCKAPDAITTLGLGSCVGISLLDPTTKIAGMVHVMLPDSTKIKKNDNRAKFADTGVDALIEQMIKIGAKRSTLIAKIAGGAQMFSFGGDNEMLCVGARNIEAAVAKLKALRIPLKGQDTGLNYGRTIEFYPETGELRIKSVGKPIKSL